MSNVVQVLEIAQQGPRGPAGEGGIPFPAWGADTTYEVGQAVGFDGRYYACVVENSAEPPNAPDSDYWTSVSGAFVPHYTSEGVFDGYEAIAVNEFAESTTWIDGGQFDFDSTYIADDKTQYGSFSFNYFGLYASVYDEFDSTYWTMVPGQFDLTSDDVEILGEDSLSLSSPSQTFYSDGTISFRGAHTVHVKLDGGNAATNFEAE